MFPKNGGLNLSSQEGYRFVQISTGNRAGGTSLIISASLNVKKAIIKQATRIPEWTFREVFRLNNDGYGSRKIVLLWRTWKSTRHATVCPVYCRRVGYVRAARLVGRYVVGTCWRLWKRCGGRYWELLGQLT